ncbi:MAG TPA: YggS family pyridoxal phosphate-dependent enzyme [Acidimicrobiia bacterium]|jgi:pyridoxal phosphate enzyme (YggS family)
MALTGYQDVMGRARAAMERSGRDPEGLTVVAVSKEQPVEAIRELYEAGHRDFGENRAQDLVEKAARLPSDIRWHFVGALQTNKTRMVRPLTHLLHSMDRSRLAGAWVKGVGLPPPVLVQVNLAQEPQKAGVAETDAASLVAECLDLGVEVRGLMIVPPLADDAEASRPWFRRLRELAEEIGQEHPEVTELSMGMTDDFEVAIEEGATIIRVGRAIFGPRQVTGA